ncbi:hypothetical protein DFJ73DRAFT_564582 [Zopfochytrium polystomum]|nr:hypothetical protein DFJ73DRAFT_564582 [Zopfochytrium polystomum]
MPPHPEEVHERKGRVHLSFFFYFCGLLVSFHTGSPFPLEPPRAAFLDMLFVRECACVCVCVSVFVSPVVFTVPLFARDRPLDINIS